MAVTQTRELVRPRTGASSKLQTIVVATDFSANATAAIEWAGQLARTHGAKIVIVHAIDSELPALAEAQGFAQHVRQKLQSIRSSLRIEVPDLRTDYAMGKPWDVIARIAKEANGDLIVVGAHGQSRFAERIVGTVADRLIKTTSIPVVVHRSEKGSVMRRIETVLAPTDFSEESMLAISMAARLLRSSNEPARLILFHTVALNINYGELNMPTALPQYWDESEQVAARQLESLAATLQSDALQVEVKTFRGFPAEAILHEAELAKADLIAMGTVGRSGLNRFFIGSVAQRVLHHAQCPVLTVRKPAPDEPIRLAEA